MSIVNDLIAEIESHLRATDMNATEFGKKAVNNPALMTRLKSGTSPTAATIDRVRAYIRENAPKKPRKAAE